MSVVKGMSNSQRIILLGGGIINKEPKGTGGDLVAPIFGQPLWYCTNRGADYYGCSPLIFSVGEITVIDDLTKPDCRRPWLILVDLS